MGDDVDIVRIWEKLDIIDNKLEIVVRLEERSSTQIKTTDSHSKRLDSHSKRTRKIENVINTGKGKIAILGTISIFIVTFVSNFVILKLKGVV